MFTPRTLPPALTPLWPPRAAAPAPARAGARSLIGAVKRRFAIARPTLNLALQGGGAHGAFTWGVLDALLADERLNFEGLSGSSAGAINAVLFAEGWRRGGRDGARAALADFWNAIGLQIPMGLLTQGEGESIGLTPAGKLMMRMTSHLSPVQWNPFDLNAFRELLLQQIDFAALRRASPFRLFLAATQANTGKLRLFREDEVSVDVVLASACLPKLHRAVTIDGEPYWDGGFAANPAVFPLFYECRSRDVLLVLLSPLRHAGPLTTAEDIEQRALELAFSANFMREMRMFVHAAAFSQGALLPPGPLERRLRAMRFHMIDTQDLPSMQRTETKLIAHPPFLQLLQQQGRARAEAWLADHADDVGRRPSVDLERWFA